MSATQCFGRNHVSETNPRIHKRVGISETKKYVNCKESTDCEEVILDNLPTQIGVKLPPIRNYRFIEHCSGEYLHKDICQSKNTTCNICKKKVILLLYAGRRLTNNQINQINHITPIRTVRLQVCSTIRFEF